MAKYPMPVVKGVGICVPLAGRPVPPDWAFAFKGLDPAINYNAALFAPRELKVDEARNQAVEWARMNALKYLFFLGDDVVPDMNPLPRFLFLLENNPHIDVIAGVYCSKSNPAAPLVFKGPGLGPDWDWKLGEFFKTWGVGMDCTMVRMSAFEKIKKPYFLTIKSDGHIDGLNYSEAWTEDLYFCKKLNEAGGQIFADTFIQCSHWDVNTMTAYRLPPNSKPAIRRAAVGKKKILDLGCGEIATIFKDGTPVRCDLRDQVKPDYRCDIRALPFASESFDVVYSSHVLEHFPRAAVPHVLDEWLRVLRPKGELRLVVPDITWAAKRLVGAVREPPDADVLNVLYGAQDDPSNFHAIGFTPASLRELLESKGLKVTTMKNGEKYNLVAQAWKTKPSQFIGAGEGRLIEKKTARELKRRRNKRP